MTAEQEVKKRYPKAVVQPWNYPPDAMTYCIYPDELIFHKISEECDTEEEAWADALRRIKAGGKA